MATTYEYTGHTVRPNFGAIGSGITNSGMIDKDVQGMTWDDGTDILIITTVNTLSAGDKIILDGVVAVEAVKPIKPLPRVVQVTAFSEDTLEFYGVGIRELVTKGTIRDIDLTLNEALYVNGAQFYAKDAVMGDWFEFQVTTGGGTVVHTWVEKWYVVPDHNVIVMVPEGGLVPSGFKLRSKYHSIGTVNDVDVVVNYYTHRDK